MKTRIISGAVLFAILLFILICGGNVLLIATGIISLIGMYELYRVFNVHKKVSGIIGYIVCVLFYLDLAFNFLPTITLLIVGFLIAELFVFVFSYPKLHANELFAIFFGFFYIALMLSCIYLTRNLIGGEYLVWLVFVCSWVCDTCAYFVGRFFGKHKMAPVLSPKKTVEGAIGGVVGSAVVAVIFGLVFKSALGLAPVQILILALICAVGGLISMVGDLAASAIKRQYEIKDYGKLIPGHGGILDRFDSVIITAPIVYFMCMYLL